MKHTMHCKLTVITLLVLLGVPATSARPADAIRAFRTLDRRIVQEVHTGRGTWGRPDAEPLTEEVTRQDPLNDSDQDGMPDSWEEEHGLDSADGSDHSRTVASGYTAIEEYCNELAAERLDETSPESLLPCPNAGYCLNFGKSILEISVLG